MRRNAPHSTRSAGTPAYYLGRTAAVWQTALRSRTCSRTRSRPFVDRTTGRVGVPGRPGVPS
jgi:hypothetical protein